MTHREKSPSFQYYPKDLLSDAKVMAMTLEEFGAYWKLTSVCWLERTIPNDRPTLARMLNIKAEKMEALWLGIADCFRPCRRKRGRLFHPRLEKEWRKQAEYRAAQAEKGRRSGVARRNPFTTREDSRRTAVQFGSSLVQTECEPKRSLLSSSSSALKDLKDPPPTPSTPKKETPVFDAGPFAVFPWMEREFQALLRIAGREDFVLFDWYARVAADLEAAGQSIRNDGMKYLRERLYRDVPLPKPSLTKGATQTPQRQKWLVDCEQKHGGTCETSAAHYRRNSETDEGMEP